MSNPNHHDPIPAEYVVQPLKEGEEPKGKTTCGHCGLSWDDDKPTSLTPAPSARCPFESFHKHPEAAYNIKTAQYIEASSIWAKFPDIQKHFSAGDNYSFSWGENNRSMIDSDSLRDELDERIDTIEAAEMDADDICRRDLPIISEERFQEFVAFLDGIPQGVYIDLEN